MATPIRIKRSAVSGKKPQNTDLQVGELALNTYDGSLFTKRDTGGVGIATTVSNITPWVENFGGTSINYSSGDVGIGTTNPSAKLEVRGDARITGILTVGESSLTLDGDNDIVNVGTALTLGHTQGIQFLTQNLHSEGFEVNQINASGIVTATSFDGDLATTNLTGTITNAQLAGSIANDRLSNSSVNYGGITLSLGSTDATPAFDLQDATNYPYTSLTGITTTILGDATPKLGGDLDGNSKNIHSVGVVTGTSFESTVTTENGAPFVVASTTKVTNLNADLLDGKSTANSNVGNSIVARNAAGGFLAGDVTFGNIVGTALSVSGIATATTFKGNLEGDVTGTIQTAAQPNITSVGTLSSLNVSGIGSIGTTLHVGTGVTVYGNSGIVSATTFKGNATTATLSIFSFMTNNSTTDETVFPVFVDGDGNLTAQGLEVDSGFMYNPSTGILTATTFKGSLTGDVTGTIQTAAQPNITSVGTLSSLDVTGDVGIGGTLTYEDVTNIDSIGIVTARQGIDVSTGGINVQAGVVTGTSFKSTVSDGTAPFVVASTTTVTNLSADKLDGRDTSDSGGNDKVMITNSSGNTSLGSGTFTAGTLKVGTAITAHAGVITATTFSGSGASLTGLTGASSGTYGNSTNTPVITVDDNGRITTISTSSISGGGGNVAGIDTTGTSVFNTLDIGGDIDVDGHTELDNLNVSGISTFNSNVIFPDGVSAKFGTDLDGEVKHTGSNLQIQETTGNIQITNYANDKDIVINTDDGSGGTATYFKADGSSGETLLYHYGNEKIKTTGYGVTVFGTTETQKLNVTGISTFTSSIHVTGVGSSVGIGTDNPDAKLQIGPLNGNSTPHLYLASTNKEYGFRIDTHDFGSENVPLRIYSRSDGTDNERIRVNQDGKVGIGTTNPSKMLTVRGTILKTRTDSGLGLIYLTNDGSQNGQILINQNGGVTRVKLDSADDSYFNGGNVGIGSVIPSAKLDVSDGTTRISFTKTGQNPHIDFKANNVPEAGKIKVAESAGGGVLQFFTKTTGGTSTERLHIDTGGRLVIGHNASHAIDANHGFRLQVSGTNFATSGIAQQRFEAGVFGATLGLAHSRNDTQGNHTILNINDEYGKIRFYGSDGTDFDGYGAEIVAKVETGIGANSTPGRLEFYTTESGSTDSAALPRMSIRADGKVGINTTDPQGDLQVGTGVTVYGNSGIVSATTFSGNADTATTAGTVTTAAQPNITSLGTLTSLNVTGDVGIGGTLTYEDVTNIDSIGIITARSGILVSAGSSVGIGTVPASGTTLDIDASGGGVLALRRNSVNTNNKITLSSDGTDGTLESTNDIIFRAGGAEALTINDDQDIILKKASIGSIHRSDTSGGVYIAAGNDTNVGGNINLFGSAHASHANHIRFRNGETVAVEIDENGKVGVGTESPTAHLQVYRKTSFAGNPIIQARSNNGSTNELKFEIDGNGDAYFNGKVGINSTSPSNTLVVSEATDNNSSIQLFRASTGGDIASINWRTNQGNQAQINYRGGGGNTGMQFYTGGTGSSNLRAIINSSGNIGIGITNPRNIANVTAHVQLEGTTASNSSLSITRNADSSAAATARLSFGRSRANSVTGVTAVAADDVLGEIRFSGADGNDLTNHAASISAMVDGSVSNNTVPGRLVFSTATGSDPIERLRIDSDGKVGIGTDLTTSPSSTLTVKPHNSTSGRNISLYTSGSVGNKAGLFFNATPATGNLAEIQAEYKGTNQGELVLSTSMQKRLTINKDGEVGIGTTTPQKKLEVYDGDIYLNSTDKKIFLSSDFDQYITANAASNYLVLGTANNERVRINSDGYLGINETSPIHPLSIGINTGTAWDSTKNISNTTNNDFIGLNIDNQNSGDNPEVGIMLQAGSSSSGQYTINCRKSAGNSADLILRTRDGGSASKETLRITADGKVGIGTDDPDTILHLQDSNHGAITLQGGTATSDLSLDFQTVAGVTTARIFSASDAGDLRFYTANTEKLRIDSSGNVGIGTITPKTSLDVRGSISMFDSLVAPHGGTVSYTVTVASKVNHRYPAGGSSSSNAYYIDGIESPVITLTPGRTYRFNTSDNTNSGHPLKFYYQADKTTEYTSGVDHQENSYTDITVNETTPSVLYYQCSAHGFMGNAVITNSEGLYHVGVSTFASVINANNGINLTASDNKSILLGVDEEMRIRHTGSNSEITDEGTGSLRLGGDQIVIGNAAFDENNAIIKQGAAGYVTLKQNGTTRFQTTSTGVVVTGILTATSFKDANGNTIGGGSGGVTVQDEGSALSTTATTLNFVGSGVSASGTGAVKTITIAGGASQDVFKTIAVSGQDDVVADSATDTLTLVAGSNVTITTDNSADSVTVGVTTEQVQDIVGAMFSGNTETNITATYQDSDGTIDLVASGGGGGGGSGPDSVIMGMIF